MRSGPYSRVGEQESPIERSDRTAIMMSVMQFEAKLARIEGPA
jgi:hypothetical protein